MTEQTVINDWKDRRDLMLAVKQRVEHQLKVLRIEITPDRDPDTDQQRRLDDLQFELRQLEQAFDDAERQYLSFAVNPDPTGEEENEGQASA